MKEKQSAQIGGKPVIVTMAKEEQLLDDVSEGMAAWRGNEADAQQLRPESRQELMSLLEHVSDVPDSPALYTILSILCKLESTHVELFWDMFRECHATRVLLSLTRVAQTSRRVRSSHDSFALLIRSFQAPSLVSPKSMASLP